MMQNEKILKMHLPQTWHWAVLQIQFRFHGRHRGRPVLLLDGETVPETALQLCFQDRRIVRDWGPGVGGGRFPPSDCRYRRSADFPLRRRGGGAGGTAGRPRLCEGCGTGGLLVRDAPSRERPVRTGQRFPAHGHGAGRRDFQGTEDAGLNHVC